MSLANVFWFYSSYTTTYEAITVIVLGSRGVLCGFCRSAHSPRCRSLCPALIPFSRPAGSLFRQFPKTSPRQSCVRAGYTRNAPGARDPETHLDSKSISTSVFKLESDLNRNLFAETFWGLELKGNVRDRLSLVTQILKCKRQERWQEMLGFLVESRTQTAGREAEIQPIHFILNRR